MIYDVLFPVNEVLMRVKADTWKQAGVHAVRELLMDDIEGDRLEWHKSPSHEIECHVYIASGEEADVLELQSDWPEPRELAGKMTAGIGVSIGFNVCGCIPVTVGLSDWRLP